MPTASHSCTNISLSTDSFFRDNDDGRETKISTLVGKVDRASARTATEEQGGECKSGVKGLFTKAVSEMYVDRSICTFSLVM